MIRVLELFAGIGACSKALTNLGLEHEIVDAVEIDKYAIKSFNAIHGTTFNPQDITKWDKEVGEIDLLMHGSPCQDFSLAGLGRGGDEDSGTRSSLMYESVRIIEKVRPHVVIWENVKAVLSKKHKHNFDRYQEAMASLGYTNYYQVLNAKDYGMPQNRERVFTVSILGGRKFQFPEKQPLELRLKDLLEKEVDESYYLSNEQVKKIKMPTYNTTRTRIQEGDISQTLCARDWKDPKCVKVGDLDIKGHDAIKRVYSPEGLSPTLTTMGGGNREPKVIEPFIAASRGRNPENPSDRTTGAPTEQRLEPKFDGTTNTITSVQKDNYVVEPSPIKRRRTEYGEAVRKDYELGKVSYTEEMKGYYVDEGGEMPTLTVNRREQKIVTPPFRVRKLTPKECWRLMGFADEDYDKASKINSNTQLYKQAGNSIVVNVLEAVLSNLFIK